MYFLLLFKRDIFITIKMSPWYLWWLRSYNSYHTGTPPLMLQLHRIEIRLKIHFDCELCMRQGESVCFSSTRHKPRHCHRWIFYKNLGNGKKSASWQKNDPKNCIFLPKFWLYCGLISWYSAHFPKSFNYYYSKNLGVLVKISLNDRKWKRIKYSLVGIPSHSEEVLQISVLKYFNYLYYLETSVNCLSLIGILWTPMWLLPATGEKLRLDHFNSTLHDLLSFLSYKVPTSLGGLEFNFHPRTIYWNW